MKDLVIIGGGLAGLSLANLLGDEWKITLIEKETYPFHKVCGEYISNESWNFLKHLGVDLDALELPKINRLLISSPSGKTLKSKLDLGGFGISRYRLDNQLKQLAEGRGVEVQEATKVLAVENQGEHFLIKTDKGTVKSRLVIGAQGKRSSLDKQLKRPFMDRRTDYLAVKYHIRNEAIPDDLIALHNFKDGYCGVSRVEDGRSCLCYLASIKSLQQAGSIPELEEQVLKGNPHLKAVLEESEYLYYSPLVISRFSFAAKEQLGQGVLFCGDAAGLITPLCGNGMSMAMHGAYLLAPMLSRYLAGNLDRLALNREYQMIWKQHFASRLKVGRALQSLFGQEFLTELFIGAIRPFPRVQRGLISLTHGRDFMH